MFKNFKQKFFLLSVLTYSIVGRLCIQAEKIAAI